MITRKILRPELITALRCHACDAELSDYEIVNYDEFDGLCEECYSQAMEAAFDDEDFKEMDLDE